MAFRSRTGSFRRAFSQLGRFPEPYRRFLKACTQDVFVALAGYKSIFAWEFGNELNLQADLPDWRTEFGRPGKENESNGRDVRRAFETFLKTVRRYDPDRRMTMYGNAAMRPERFHLYARGIWVIGRCTAVCEDFENLQSRKNGYRDRASVRIGTEFRRSGRISLDERLSIAVKTAGSLKKGVRRRGIRRNSGFRRRIPQVLRSFFDAGVRFSLIWNFSLRSEFERSFTADSFRGAYPFRPIREYDAKYDRLRR